MTSTLERLTAALADRYRVDREIGAGGMATVYLAEDLKHRRRVALKVLKPELAAVLGAERFVQEITTTAALQHPHILPLFDSGTADGFLYYVMPFIDGETLRAKLDRETQLGIEEALRIAGDVADALHYAHQQGIIHRDIKPENILLANGRPMVADFGIALAVSAAAGGRMTETGLSLGTPHYMSPEQATAEREISARSDVYSLASVLYEMLSGEPPHMGNSAQQIIMKIIAEPAQLVTKLRRAVPHNVAAALAKALEKLPADRFESAQAFAAALHNAHFTTAGMDSERPGRRAGWRVWVAHPLSWATLAAVVVLAAWSLVGATRTPPVASANLLRFTVVGPPDSAFLSMNARGPFGISTPVISPGDRHVAFTVTRGEGSALYVRALDATELMTVAEGRGVGVMFWSPDGASIGFFKSSELWTMRLTEGRAERLTIIGETEWDISTAAWHRDGRILIAGARGLWSVPSQGGDPQLLLPVREEGERITELQILPDDRLLIAMQDKAGGHVEVIDADGGKRTRILAGSVRASFVDGVMLHARSGELRAVRFDLRALRETGATINVQDPGTTRLGASIAWADEGLLNLTPVWRHPAGVVEALDVPAASYRWPRLSPDGRRMVIGSGVARAPLRMYDLDRRAWFSLAGSTEPAWTPDGRFVIQSIGNRPRAGLIMQVADGSREADTLLALTQADAWPTDVSSDGKWLAYYGAARGEAGGESANDDGDLYFMELSTRQTRRTRLPGTQRGGRFSPDMRFVAYESSETGRSEVIVRDWPALAARYVISAGDATEPNWSRDGKLLFFRRGTEMQSVSFSGAGDRVDVTAPTVLFSGNYRRDESGDQSYDVGADGRFLLLRPQTGGRASVEVVLNWIAEIQRKLDTAK